MTYTRDGVATEDITAPGDYVATILIDDGNYDWGGIATLKFHVAATRVDVDEIYASYKGETLKSASVRDIYSGEDLMANLTVKAIDEDDKEVRPTSSHSPSPTRTAKRSRASSRPAPTR